jgi:N-acetylglucosaminyl-diphospho-decaprenol L-rhamnosyltransferase
MSADVEVVVVSYGAAELLRACLLSLRSRDPGDPELAVHVVDNASPDGIPDLVAAEFPEVQLHRLAENAGFSAANNVVLRRPRAPFVLILNPDTELPAGTLGALLPRFAERPDVGMVGCRLVQSDGSFDHAAKRSFPTPLAAAAHFARIGRRTDDAALGQYRATGVNEHGVGEVDAVNGAFMLVRREALEQVGPFDEGYWLYMEDLDWCARFWAAGWKVLYDGTVTALHHKGGSAGKHRALRQNWHFHRGMGRFYRRHDAGARPLLDAGIYGAILVKFGVSAVRSAIARRRG